MSESKFLQFRDMKGEVVLVRADAVMGVASNMIQMPAGGQPLPCTVLLCSWGQISVKETVEQVEAILQEKEFD